MANRFMSGEEVNREIIAPLLRMVADDLEARPLAPGEARTYKNPLGSDMLPMRVSGNRIPEIVVKLRKLADEMTRPVEPS